MFFGRLVVWTRSPAILLIIYGCGGWTLATADEKKTNAFETKCYRRILRIPWIEKKTQKS